MTASGLDGGNGPDSLSSGGGGAGGSIWVDADTLSGSGTVSALGGDAYDLAARIGGGGGGGRIVFVARAANTFTGTVSANGGTGSQSGQNGTVVGPASRPTNPTLTKIFEGNGVSTRELTSGGLTSSTTITFASDMLDPNVGSNVRLQIELRTIGQEFQSVPTHSQVSYTLAPKSCSTPVSDCGSITVTGLTSGVEYKVRYRVQNESGITSQWVDFGTSEDTDFIVVGAASSLQKISGDSQSATVGSALANPNIAKLVDSSGYGVPLTSLTWTVMSGGGSVIGDATTDEEGYIQANWTVGTSAGVDNNSLRVGKFSGSTLQFSTTFLASATADTLNHYTVTASSPAIINENFMYTVRSYDQYNNPVAYVGNLEVYPFLDDGITPGSGTLTPATISMNGTELQITNAQYNFSESIKVCFVFVMLLL